MSEPVTKEKSPRRVVIALGIEASKAARDLLSKLDMTREDFQDLMQAPVEKLALDLLATVFRRHLEAQIKVLDAQRHAIENVAAVDQKAEG